MGGQSHRARLRSDVEAAGGQNYSLDERNTRAGNDRHGSSRLGKQPAVDRGNRGDIPRYVLVLIPRIRSLLTL